MAMPSRQVPARRQQPQRTRTDRPRLRVIPGGAAATSPAPASRTVPASARRIAPKSLSIQIGRPTIAFAAAVLATVAAFVFGLVLLNIYLAQSSFTLAEIQSSALREEAKYRRMRFEVARAESPEKVAEIAAQLGLVPPAEQEYLVGPSAGDPSQTGVEAAGLQARNSMRR